MFFLVSRFFPNVTYYILIYVYTILKTDHEITYTF